MGTGGNIRRDLSGMGWGEVRDDEDDKPARLTYYLLPNARLFLRYFCCVLPSAPLRGCTETATPRCLGCEGIRLPVGGGEGGRGGGELFILDSGVTATFIYRIV